MPMNISAKTTNNKRRTKYTTYEESTNFISTKSGDKNNNESPHGIR